MARGNRFNPLSFFFFLAIILYGLYGGFTRENGPRGDALPKEVPAKPTGGHATGTSPGNVEVPPPIEDPPPRILAGTVLRVLDGDTLDLQESTRTVRIRLAGIDAPEYDQPFGRAAREHLDRMCKGRSLQAVVLDRDQLGRAVADVYLQDRWVNGEMVLNGLAWHFVRFDNSRELSDYEQQARLARRGLWSNRSPEPPWDWRDHKKASR